MTAPTGQLHLELVDNEKVVFNRILKVDKTNRLRAPLIPIRQPLGHCSLEQKRSGGLIDFHQAMTGGLFQVADGAGDSIFIQPRLAVA